MAPDIATAVPQLAAPRNRRMLLHDNRFEDAGRFRGGSRGGSGLFPPAQLVRRDGALRRRARELGPVVVGIDAGGMAGVRRRGLRRQDTARLPCRQIRVLKTRGDIDPTQVGLLGVSQAGWVMPIAAVREPAIRFLISISGAGIVPAETTFDNVRNEMAAAGRRPEVIEQVISLMRLQYRFAETGDGWDQYIAARQQLAARLGGTPPPSFPATRDDPLWQTMRAFYFYDPGPTLRRLRTPTLAMWGELDTNILPEKNKAAWEAALKVAENPDYTLRVLSRGNHLQLEARSGSNAETASLNGFVPEYFTTIEGWLAKRIRGFTAAGSSRSRSPEGASAHS